MSLWTYTLWFLQSGVLLKHYKIMFSAEHSFCVSQIVKPLSKGNPKWHFWNQKCHFRFSLVPAESPIFVVFGDILWLHKMPFSQTDSCNENARLFLPSEHKSVCLWEKSILQQNTIFAHNHPKRLLHFFEVFFFHFFIFLFCTT